MVLLEQRHELALELLPRPPAVIQEMGGQAGFARAPEGGCRLDVRDDDPDLRAQDPRAGGVEEGQEVAATAGDENAHSIHRFPRPGPYSNTTPSPFTTEPMTKLVSPRRSRECSTSCRSVGGHDHHHAHPHVEGAEHLVVGDAAHPLDQAEEREEPPRSPRRKARPQARGKHPREVAPEAAARDVAERPHLVALEQRLQGGEVAPVGGQEGRAHGGPELGQVSVHAVALEVEEHLAGQRVAVRVQARRGQGQEHVALRHPAGQGLLPLHHAHDEPGEVVVVLRVGAGHLRRLPPDERTGELGAGAGEAAHDGLDLRGIHPAEGDVVEEEKGRRSLHEDVVHAVGHEVVAHGVVDAGRDRDLDLGAHAVGGSHEHRLLVARRSRGGTSLRRSRSRRAPPALKVPRARALIRALAASAARDVDARLAVVHETGEARRVHSRPPLAGDAHGR